MYYLLEIWGDGSQMRSYCYIDDAGILLMESSYNCPIYIGSYAVSVLVLSQICANILGIEKVEHKCVNGPTGVHTRTSDKKKLIRCWAGGRTFY